jgi:hypothetical protein
LCRAGSVESFLGVLTDGFEQPIAPRGVAVVAHDQRFLDEMAEQVHDVERVDAAAADDRLGGTEVPAAYEHRQPVECGLLFGAEEVVGGHRQSELESQEREPA